MPNLVPRTSLRSLEAVRNSRSMEANLQSSGNRMSRLPQSPSTGRYQPYPNSTPHCPLFHPTPPTALPSSYWPTSCSQVYHEASHLQLNESSTILLTYWLPSVSNTTVNLHLETGELGFTVKLVLYKKHVCVRLDPFIY